MSHAVLDTIITAVRTNLPPGITDAYLDGFVDRHRAALLAILDEALRKSLATRIPWIGPICKLNGGFPA